MSLIPAKTSNKAIHLLLYGNTACSNLYAVTIQSWIPGWYISREKLESSTAWSSNFSSRSTWVECELHKKWIDHIWFQQSILREFEKACSGVTLIDAEDQCLLGAPLGLNALDRALEKKKEDLARLFDQILTIPPPPRSLFPNETLFRHSEVFVSPAHVTSLQAWPENGWTDTYHAGYIWENNGCSNNWWGVGSNHSPGKTGGFGLRSPVDNASSAYISSSVSCYDFISALLEHETVIVLLREAVTDWIVKVNCDKPPPLERHRQKSWTEPIAKRCQEEMMGHANDIPLVRIKGCAALSSGDRLNTRPSSALRLPH